MLRPADDVKRNRLVGIAAETTNLKVAIPSVQSITEGWGRLSGPFITEHAVVPRLTGCQVCDPARLLRALS